jgi:hypothetical protein
MRDRDPDPDAVDYYSRIGASSDADAETIRRRRKQADRRFSPMGASPDADEKRHMQVNEASAVLEDEDERARYDDCYDALGPINGTIAYRTLSTGVVDDVRDDGTLLDHLRGFVEVLGPKSGAREFERYHNRLSTPLPEDIGDTDLPNGYTVSDVGFGVAAWSWHESEKPCAFSLWLTGGKQLWRTALLEPDAIDGQLDALRNNGPASVPQRDDQSTDEGTPATQISLGHPSSGGSSTPSSRGLGTTERARVSALTSALSTPAERLANVLTYVGATGLWAGGSLLGTAGGGIAGAVLVGVLFVPLLAAALLLESSVGGFVFGGVPLVDLNAPLATVGVVHYLVVGLLVCVPAGVTARYVVPAVRERKETALPRDAWLVFGLILPALAGALFVGVGQSALPQRPGIALTTVLTVFTFQAAMDVGAPRYLSLLCRSVATIAFGLISSVVALTGVGFVLSSARPAVSRSYTAVIGSVPAVQQPIVSTANAELLVVAAGALAFVPLALTTLYSLAYAVESAALRIRSRAYN